MNMKIKDLMETINQFGSINVVDEPSYLEAICEYVLMNGVKSDWNTLYDAMQCLRIGEEKIDSGMMGRVDGPSLEGYAGTMYRCIFNLYSIWHKDSWVADEHKYVESKDYMIRLSEVCHLIIDYLYEYVYDEE